MMIKTVMDLTPGELKALIIESIAEAHTSINTCTIENWHVEPPKEVLHSESP